MSEMEIKWRISLSSSPLDDLHIQFNGRRFHELLVGVGNLCMGTNDSQRYVNSPIYVSLRACSTLSFNNRKSKTMKAPAQALSFAWNPLFIDSRDFYILKANERKFQQFFAIWNSFVLSIRWVADAANLEICYGGTRIWMNIDQFEFRLGFNRICDVINNL